MGGLSGPRYNFEMCYSAQVVQVVRKLYRQLGIRLDYAEAERLFLRRLDEPTLNISRGFEANFDDPQTDLAPVSLVDDQLGEREATQIR